MSLIYLVEDDESIRELVIYALKNSGNNAYGFENSNDFYNALNKLAPDMFILDIMLPQKDGITILKELKSSKYKDIPVIMLTAKGSEFDKVKALDIGADDYIVKPFGVMELLSRINAVLRRVSKDKNNKETIYFSNITINQQSRCVYVENTECFLTYKEYELLTYLINNKNIVMTRENIMDEVWGFDYEGESRTVDMHIKTLRQKLGKGASVIKTVRNVGYVAREE